VVEVLLVVNLNGSAVKKLYNLTENRILKGSIGFDGDRDLELECMFKNSSIMEKKLNRIIKT
jgi:hypothetical protein